MCTCIFAAVNGLTSTKDVIEHLEQFNSLDTDLLEEIEAGKPPNGHLYKHFDEARQQNKRKTCLAFFGTSDENIAKIRKEGYYDNLEHYGPYRLRKRKKFVGKISFATDPKRSMRYCQGNKLIVNELLLGKQGVDYKKFNNGNIRVKSPCNALPRFIVTFKQDS